MTCGTSPRRSPLALPERAPKKIGSHQVDWSERSARPARCLLEKCYGTNLRVAWHNSHSEPAVKKKHGVHGVGLHESFRSTWRNVAGAYDPCSRSRELLTINFHMSKKSGTKDQFGLVSVVRILFGHENAKHRKRKKSRHPRSVPALFGQKVRRLCSRPSGKTPTCGFVLLRTCFV